MTDEQKQELFPYFAYTYSKQTNPEKYGNISFKQWYSEIQNNQDPDLNIDEIKEYASQLPEEEWDNLGQMYEQEQSQSELQFAAKGAKLKMLKNKTKKCSCGCDMITVKGEGGKLISSCSCKCGGKLKPKKHANGGWLNRLQKGGLVKTTKDSTDIYMNRLENSKNSKEFDKNAKSLNRQDDKGKPGFDKNGFPIKTVKKQVGGKVRIKNSKSVDTDETWSPDEVGTGNKSMNPKDWVKSKKEMDLIKKSNNDYHVSKLKPPVKKEIKTEIVPLKKEDGGKVPKRIEKAKITKKK